MIPGEVLPGDGPIEINPGREVVTLTVRNTGDRPVQVGSHFHFAECNAALDFDRDAAWGRRLAVPAGTSVRFEPGMPRDVGLVALGGNRVVPGLRGLAGGALDVTPSAAPSSSAPTSPSSSAPSSASTSPSTSPSSSASATPEGESPAGAAPVAAKPQFVQPENGSPR